MKSYFKRYFENMPGKMVAQGFWDSEDLDKFFGKVGTLAPPYEHDRFKLFRWQVAGRLEDYQKLVASGDPGLGILLIHQGTSWFYTNEPLSVIALGGK